MQTYKLYANNPNPRILQDIAQVIRDGGVVIYPTDSVYAIGCDALNQRAVEKIYQYRKEEEVSKSPLSIICRDISQADEYTRISKEQFKLMHRHLPGPFTFILEAGLRLPKVFRSRKNVGIRIPDNAILQALLAELDGPLLTTSLKAPVTDDNADAVSYMTDPFLIEEAFQHQADVLIDGGYGEENPSTVVDLTGDEPVVVRQGAGEF